ncbi:anaphase-promoting complex subunit 5-domain-containing protein [Xylogone sp. PMI_703]|nr:anaphase-promoting complex subunit 5-domain-containing protein [Xylogone sp. PMI_703]
MVTTFRFLTPAKIGLLVLIELYVDSSVPSSAAIPVLDFLLKNLLPALSSLQQKKEAIPADSLPFNPDLDTFETLLAAHTSATGLPGRTLWDNFLEKLWNIDSLHALHEFFENRTQYLVPRRAENREEGERDGTEDRILLSRSSPLGSYIRRAKLQFERLRFEDSVALWRAFMTWRAKTMGYWARKKGELSKWAGDIVLGDGELEWGAEGSETLALAAYGVGGVEETSNWISTQDVVSLLEFQVEQMQKFGTRLAPDMKDKFKDILSDSYSRPQLSHYMNFLEAWRAGDYPTSFDCLYRYFDFTDYNSDRHLYQYALMNLAVLQADFGCFEEAVDVMLETVATARENSDTKCLNFALNWLYHFRRAHPDITRESTADMLNVDREGLKFLSHKSRERGMWSMWSSSFLAEAQAGMSNGESVATAFENILKSSKVIVDKNVSPMIGPLMLFQASAWARIGISQLSEQYCEVFLRSHASSSDFNDTLRFTCQAAFLLANRGRYKEAIEKLEALDQNSLRSWKANQHWTKFRALLRLQRDLRKNNLHRAEHLLSQLVHFTGPDTDASLALEINMLRIDYLTRRMDFASALAKVEELAARCQETGDDLHILVRLLIVKALLQDKAGRPQRGFSIAVRAASIAWRARILPDLWSAMGAISNILTSLSEFEASVRILNAVIPRALEYEDSALSARMFSFLADAHMGIAGQAEPGSLKRTENLTKSLEYIGRAFSEYSDIEDINGQCEAMAKKATIARAMGDIALADDHAEMYLALKKEAASETALGIS